MQASDFTALIPDCCADVLETMYFTSVLDSGPVAETPAATPDSHCFSLEFVGEVRGRFGLALTDETARSLTANFLGEDDSELAASEVGETVGELANMLCGSVMSRVRTSEKFVLSHPAPDAQLPNAEAGESVLRVDTDAGELLLWVVVDGAQ
jgi:CheY-specific phosphatase CheX